ncbi:MAG: SIMPL domain-containing protein [Hydrogenophilaceae bacterium]|nr:SIMPL domain-containing protein [Hydrogenophilaceae bacterium]
MRSLIAATALTAAALTAPAAAQAQTGPSGRHHMMMEGAMLTVTAEGEIEAAPDMATISLGVTTEGQTAQAALAANAQRMNALTQALRRANVAERDIQTSNVSVNPQYVYQENEAPRISGYQAQNMVTVKVHELGNLGRIIDASVAAGGTNVNGVTFGLDNPEPRLDEARREAMQRARARADLYAQAAGMRVHRIIAITEGYHVAPPVPMPYMRAEAMDGAASTPIAPGEIRTSANVTVVFELR